MYVQTHSERMSAHVDDAFKCLIAAETTAKTKRRIRLQGLLISGRYVFSPSTVGRREPCSFMSAIKILFTDFTKSIKLSLLCLHRLLLAKLIDGRLIIYNAV